MSDFFLGNLAKSYQNIISYSKAWFISFQRNFEFFNSVQAINIYASILLKYPNFAFVQGSVDLVIKVQISKFRLYQWHVLPWGVDVPAGLRKFTIRYT